MKGGGGQKPLSPFRMAKRKHIDSKQLPEMSLITWLFFSTDDVIISPVKEVGIYFISKIGCPGSLKSSFKWSTAPFTGVDFKTTFFCLFQQRRIEISPAPSFNKRLYKNGAEIEGNMSSQLTRLINKIKTFFNQNQHKFNF